MFGLTSVYRDVKLVPSTPKPSPIATPSVFCTAWPQRNTPSSFCRKRAFSGVRSGFVWGSFCTFPKCRSFVFNKMMGFVSSKNIFRGFFVPSAPEQVCRGPVLYVRGFGACKMEIPRTLRPAQAGSWRTGGRYGHWSHCNPPVRFAENGRFQGFVWGSFGVRFAHFQNADPLFSIR